MDNAETQEATQQTNQQTNQQSKNNDYTESKLRKRAQAAESELDTIKTDFAAMSKHVDTLTGKLKTYEFAEKKTNIISELVSKLPTEKQLNAESFNKIIQKFTNPDTIEKDIADIFPDFVVDKVAAKQVAAIPFQGTPTKTVDIDSVNPMSYNDRLKLYKDNPAAYEQMVEKEKSKKGVRN